MAAEGAPEPPPPPAPEPATERRLVSVLFADLVGFTSVSEARDSEQVRALLSRYFDTCRRLIELYGGTVEKFIGDAVMAVWGAQTATENDAERAVRAALDLVAAVTALGDEVGIDGLQARAGVATGEATVTVGAEGEGMVAGDLVNTASRIQSLADPARVLVADSTRRATEPTIVFEDTGEHELKGKIGLYHLYRAVRVVSGARGSLRSEGLEAPFVGRDRELRQIKDMFHACAEEKRPHLVSVTGIAGIGKSRLVWEFYKYFDGLAQVIYWHRGRCPSYGEGVTYWALADMVRMRCRIAEDEPAASAAEKLQAVLDEHIPDAGEREFVGPRVAQLLGMEGGGRFEREDLFSAWRRLLRAAGRRLPDGARLRGHAVGRRVAARLHRVPARVVAKLAALRDHRRPAGAGRAAADLGRGQAKLHLALPGAAARAGHAGAPGRAWWPASRRRSQSRSWPAPRGCRCMRWRRCGCCSTAASWCRRARSTGRPARSRRWRCRRRCTR